MFRTKITTMLYNFSLAKKQTMFECNKFDRANSRVPKKYPTEEEHRGKFVYYRTGQYPGTLISNYTNMNKITLCMVALTYTMPTKIKMHITP